MTRWWLRITDRYFALPSADEIAARELEETKRQLLLAHADKESAEARVYCYTQRIARLEKPGGSLHGST